MSLLWLWRMVVVVVVLVPSMALTPATAPKSSPPASSPPKIISPALSPPHNASKPATPAPARAAASAPAPSRAIPPARAPAPSRAKLPARAPAPVQARAPAPARALPAHSPPPAAKPPAHSKAPAASPSLPPAPSTTSPALAPKHPAPHLPPKAPPAISPAVPPVSALPPRSAHKPAPPPLPVVPSNVTGGLDPTQASALKSLGVRLGTNPCTSLPNILLCNHASPHRSVIALQLEYCPASAVLTTPALAALTSLQALSFLDCPMLPVHVPLKLIASLTSFSCIASLGKTDENPTAPGLPGIWLSRLVNLTSITVTDVAVNVSGLNVIVSEMKHLTQLKLARTNFSGMLPKRTWPPNVTSIDVSGNLIHGAIPSLFGKLTQLQEINLGNNKLTGFIPNVFGKMNKLQKLVLASNGFSGPIPDSITTLSSLTYLDLSGNRLNGSILESISALNSLRYLDLSNNNFVGPIPFNKTFISKLSTLKVTGNSGICYNHTTFKSRFLVGVPACDINGMPILPGNSPAPSPGAFAPAGGIRVSSGGHHHRGPKTVVSAIAITLAVLVVFIVLAVLISKCRSRKH